MHPLSNTGHLKFQEKVLLALATNAVEVFKIPSPHTMKQEGTTPEASRLYSVDMPGHRTDIRTVAVSSDDQILSSASNGMSFHIILAICTDASLQTSGQLKIWNLRTTVCIRTLDCGYAICSSFLPGDKHVRHFVRKQPILSTELIYR